MLVQLLSFLENLEDLPARWFGREKYVATTRGTEGSKCQLVIGLRLRGPGWLDLVNYVFPRLIPVAHGHDGEVCSGALKGWHSIGFSPSSCTSWSTWHRRWRVFMNSLSSLLAEGEAMFRGHLPVFLWQVKDVREATHAALFTSGGRWAKGAVVGTAAARTIWVQRAPHGKKRTPRWKSSVKSRGRKSSVRSRRRNPQVRRLWLVVKEVAKETVIEQGETGNILYSVFQCSWTGCSRHDISSCAIDKINENFCEEHSTGGSQKCAALPLSSPSIDLPEPITSELITSELILSFFHSSQSFERADPNQKSSTKFCPRLCWTTHDERKFLRRWYVTAKILQSWSFENWSLESWSLQSSSLENWSLQSWWLTTEELITWKLISLELTTLELITSELATSELIT